MISWVEQGCVLEKTETRGKAREVLVVHSMYDFQDEGRCVDVHQGSKQESDRRGVPDRPPGVHGNGGLEFMSSEQSGKT